jgi:hypothetical protein
MITMIFSIRKVAIALAVAISSATTMFAQPNYVSALPAAAFEPTVTNYNPLICPDLAAKEIKYQLVRRDSATTGRVRITGVIQNVGNKKYIQSSRYGHNFSLAESNTSAVAPPLSSFNISRGFRPVTNLAPGEKMELSYEMDWYTGNDFPPFYEVKISYYESSNSRGVNTDCNLTNNRIERGSEAINALFTR